MCVCMCLCMHAYVYVHIGTVVSGIGSNGMNYTIESTPGVC